MPELPEVETSRRGIAPFLQQQTVQQLLIRQPRLRWPIPEDIYQVVGQTIVEVKRRAKYLLLESERGTVIIHLGMSGCLRLLPEPLPPGKHDHVDLLLSNGYCLRYTDPRRFGAMLWADTGYLHPVLSRLGPEPFAAEFTATYLYQQAQMRRVSVKQLIMNNQVVVGVGNIYANEALFRAGIAPASKAHTITQRRYQRLVKEIIEVLQHAIQQGGTTLRNFLGGDGKPGYFKQQLLVYGRAGQACKRCQTILQELRINQRSTVFCKKCQS